MPTDDEIRLCPNCETEMIAGEGKGILLCPVCTFELQPCPACGGTMAKQVIAPEGVTIGVDGLHLGLCEISWICGDPQCAHRVEASPE